MTDQPQASLADCNDKLASFNDYKTQREGHLTAQEAHAWELNAIHIQQETLEGAVTTKEAECRALVGTRTSLEEAANVEDALAAAAAAVPINARLREIADRLAVIWPQISGDNPPDSPFEVSNLMSEAEALIDERTQLEADLEPHLEMIALYNAALGEIAALDEEIATCDGEVQQAHQAAIDNVEAFDQRTEAYELERGLAESKLNGMIREQGRMIDVSCDLHEGFTIPDIDDSPGVTFEDTLAPPEDPEEFEEGEDLEEIEVDEAPDSDEFDEVPDEEEFDEDDEGEDEYYDEDEEAPDEDEDDSDDDFDEDDEEAGD